MSAPVPPTPPAQTPPPVQPAADPAAAPASGTFFGSLVASITPLGVLYFVLGSLPSIIFAYGAAKVNWSVNQSPFWAVIAFLFCGFYYPYYAFFQLPAGSVLQTMGARRRR